jgi:hypothetical protein
VKRSATRRLQHGSRDASHVGHLYDLLALRDG